MGTWPFPAFLVAILAKGKAILFSFPATFAMYDFLICAYANVYMKTLDEA